MSAKFEKKGTNDGVLTFSVDQTLIEKGLKQAFDKVKKILTYQDSVKGKCHVKYLTVCTAKKHCMKML